MDFYVKYRAACILSKSYSICIVIYTSRHKIIFHRLNFAFFHFLSCAISSLFPCAAPNGKHRNKAAATSGQTCTACMPTQKPRRLVDENSASHTTKKPWASGQLKVLGTFQELSSQEVKMLSYSQEHPPAIESVEDQEKDTPVKSVIEVDNYC